MKHIKMIKPFLAGAFILTIVGCSSPLNGDAAEQNTKDTFIADSAADIHFDFDTKTVMLNSGYPMPIVGLGTYALSDEVCVDSVTALLEYGGRLIDTASFYGTEKSVGKAIRDSKIPREEIFVTTKLYPNQFSNAAKAIDQALENLGIVVEGWFPFGGRGHTKELFSDEVIVKIAEAHQKSSAQVILRWNLQKGIVVIPGSSNSEHIKENLDIFDFELTKEEMEQINSLNRDEKHEWY